MSMDKNNNFKPVAYPRRKHSSSNFTPYNFDIIVKGRHYNESKAGVSVASHKIINVLQKLFWKVVHHIRHKNRTHHILKLSYISILKKIKKCLERQKIYCPVMKICQAFVWIRSEKLNLKVLRMLVEGKTIGLDGDSIPFCNISADVNGSIHFQLVTLTMLNSNKW